MYREIYDVLFSLRNVYKGPGFRGARTDAPQKLAWAGTCRGRGEYLAFRVLKELCQSPSHVDIALFKKGKLVVKVADLAPGTGLVSIADDGHYRERRRSMVE